MKVKVRSLSELVGGKLVTSYGQRGRSLYTRLYLQGGPYSPSVEISSRYYHAIDSYPLGGVCFHMPSGGINQETYIDFKTEGGALSLREGFKYFLHRRGVEKLLENPFLHDVNRHWEKLSVEDKY